MEEQIKIIRLTESTRCSLPYSLIEKINNTVIAHNNLFQMGIKEIEIKPLIQLFNNQWWVNRFVGEVSFDFEGVHYKVIVEPRFGEVYLFKLLETIFNFQFAKSTHEIRNKQKNENYIKQIIAKIWVFQLGLANKYGLPRKSIKSNHYGPQIKGKLDIRGSINIIYSKRQIKSQFYQKSLDQKSASILYRAYNILNQDYGLPIPSKLPKSVQGIIQQLDSESVLISKSIDTNYSTQKLSSVYNSFKSVLELSLDIIKKRNKENKYSDFQKEGYSFFLDMAEIWELYLFNLLKREFSKDGWRISSPVLEAYPNKFFRTKLIPDIVLIKDKEAMVLDAKYKFMRGQKFDIDRTDFFQIHTYMSYFEKDHNVKVSGLLFPYSYSLTLQEKGSDSIINKHSKFLIEGINFELLDIRRDSNTIAERFEKLEKKFLNDLKSHL